MVILAGGDRGRGIFPHRPGFYPHGGLPAGRCDMSSLLWEKWRVCGDTDGGISEVVGALLMVAVVVVLAAIAGTMVFGMELPGEPKTLVVTAMRSGV